ncbi:MAG: VWA domain-containing protein [Planctomycetota bacterium]
MYVVRRIAVGLLLSLLASLAFESAAKEPDSPKIQIALLLDTSNSMDGLIGQAKSQLWRIVNLFAHCKREGKTPIVEVSLYEYGNSGLPEAAGFIRQVLPFTTDLDAVSEQLFILRTKGGNEFCGMVIDRAVRELSWSDGKNDLKAIFIAGNEPFTQGSVDYRSACELAVGKGIGVNTIHCGDRPSGESGGWQSAALMGGGTFSSIDQNRIVVTIETPQDKEIIRLGVEINKTYIAYGSQGKTGELRQTAQDANSSSVSTSSLVDRCFAKCSDNYKNRHWDLVDAIKEKIVKLEELRDEVLPESMRKMSLEERRNFVAACAKRRADIQNEVTKLQIERQKYIDAEMRRRGDKDDESSLDDAVIGVLRDRARKLGFEFEGP